eukprot:7590326-Pyramimonas_sp.AAC.2
MPNHDTGVILPPYPPARAGTCALATRRTARCRTWTRSGRATPSWAGRTTTPQSSSTCPSRTRFRTTPSGEFQGADSPRRGNRRSYGKAFLQPPLPPVVGYAECYPRVSEWGSEGG